MAGCQWPWSGYQIVSWPPGAQTMSRWSAELICQASARWIPARRLVYICRYGSGIRACVGELCLPKGIPAARFDGNF